MNTDEHRIAELIVEELEKTRKISDKQHTLHHEWVQGQIQKQKRRDEMLQGIKKNVVVWGILAVLGAISTAVWHAIEAWKNSGNGH